MVNKFFPHLYFARMDVSAVGLSEFKNWYDTKHAPDLIDAGFYSAQAYHCYVGGPLVCNLYEIRDSEIFYTTSYQQKRTVEHDPQRPHILEMVSNRSNTVYSQVATVGVALPTKEWESNYQIGAVESTVISTTRFEVPKARESYLDRWVREQEFPYLSAQVGCCGARLGRQAGRPHPANPSKEPNWVLLSEWVDQESASITQADGGMAQRMVENGFEPMQVSHNLAVRVTRARMGAQLS